MENNYSEDALLTAKEVSEIFKIPVSTLNTMRSRKGSSCPPYYKINASVRYSKRDFGNWLIRQKIENGAD